jgi:hypothetical protein
MMDHLLNAEVMLPPMPALLRPGAWVVARFLRAATIATMPRWMRRMAGLRQPRVVDALVTPVMKVSFRLANLSPRLQVLSLRQLSPATVPVAAPVLLGIPPQRAETLTPAAARERYGYEKPAEAHREWRERQMARVFDDGEEPSDAGLRESEPALGPLA